MLHGAHFHKGCFLNSKALVPCFLKLSIWFLSNHQLGQAYIQNTEYIACLPYYL
uniref:Uncharacterized protein n=1 Tax=Lotus japonicus TaxID=34305 RepID=I3SEJ0_LOTJA|nr:unknown [Lotus japonicus]